MLLTHDEEVEIYRVPNLVSSASISLVFSIEAKDNFKRCNNYIRVYKTNKENNDFCDTVVNDSYYVISDPNVKNEMENILCKEDEYITIRSFIRKHNIDTEVKVNLEVNMVER